MSASFKSYLLCNKLFGFIFLLGAMAIAFFLFVFSSQTKEETSQQTKAHVLAQFFKLPLYFESNEGQMEPNIKYLARRSGCNFYFTPQEILMSLREKETSSLLKIQFIGANSNASLHGLEKQDCTSNYFKGNDPKHWHKEIPNYGKVLYQELYPGIDAVFYGNSEQLEYDLCLAPRIDPQTIRLHIEGTKELSIDEGGNLYLLTENENNIQMKKPFVYQMIEGKQVSIAGEFVLLAKQDVGFRVGEYDTSKLLVIDPILSYSTYLGGSLNDSGNSIAVDSSGNAYVTGLTASIDFPTTVGAFQPANAGLVDAFVTKMNATGTGLVYSTYLGGSLDDRGLSIAVDSSGSAYVTGLTTSTDFPTTVGAFQTAKAGGQDAFVTKMNATGTGLVYSTYLGGSLISQGNSIAVDSSGSAYVTGLTTSTDFPTTVGAFQPANAGLVDAFVTKMNVSGTGLVYSTYLGGSSNDVGNGIAVDSSGSAYVTGLTTSTDFPTTVGAFQTTFTGGQDAFVTKMNATGTALVYSTYLGGNLSNQGNSIAVDSSGSAYVTGSTTSTDFPTTAGAFQPANAGSVDAFVTKMNATGTGLVYSTYLGGSLDDVGNGIAVDSSGSAYVTGSTLSTDFPTTVGAFQTANAGSADAFVTKMNATGTGLVYSTYLGGSLISQGNSIAVDSSGSAYITGLTDSTDFPTTAGAFQPALAGIFDAFITKFIINPIVTGINPTSGPTFGGTVVTITGINFSDVTAVFFGTDAATSFIIINDNTIQAVSPPHAVGTVDVRVESPFGISAITPNDEFTYVLTPTSTTLTASPNPASFGQTVTLTATVTSALPFIPTGTVSFFDGAVFLGQAPLVGGVATLNVSTFAAGTHSLTAVYSGDANFSGSTSPAVLLVINQRSTSTTLTVSPNPASFGQTVTLTATVTPASATGTVAFFDGGVFLGQAPLIGGVATLNVSTFSIGTHSLTAVYSGDANFSGSTSPPVILVVTPAVFPPNHVRGFQKANEFATQTDYVNILKWKRPMQGNSPVTYQIYRDRHLRKLIAKISSKQRLRFEDHQRRKGKTYTYYIVSIDQFGNVSAPAVVKIDPRF